MFQKLLSKERERTSQRVASEETPLTRYAPDQARPACASQLTRFKQEHSRTPEPLAEITPPAKPQHAQIIAKPVAPPRTAPPVAHAAPPPPAVAPAPTQIQHTQHVSRPTADLYSNAPITVGVLKRSLPLRFRQMQADIGDVFASKDSGLKHA